MRKKTNAEMMAKFIAKVIVEASLWMAESIKFSLSTPNQWDATTVL
jgi:hypothetical protein